MPAELLIASTIIVLAAVAAVMTAITWIVRYARASPSQRRVIRKVCRVRWTWRRTALRVGLSHTGPVKVNGPAGSGRRTLVPQVRVLREVWGVRIEARTVGRVGLEEFQAAADHLANAWRVPLDDLFQGVSDRRRSVSVGRFVRWRRCARSRRSARGCVA